MKRLLIILALAIALCLVTAAPAMAQPPVDPHSVAVRTLPIKPDLPAQCPITGFNELYIPTADKAWQNSPVLDAD